MPQGGDEPGRSLVRAINRSGEPRVDEGLHLPQSVRHVH
jgi:hypothetical protein